MSAQRSAYSSQIRALGGRCIHSRGPRRLTHQAASCQEEYAKVVRRERETEHAAALLDPTGRGIQAFDLADEQWRALELKNRKTRHLRMPCCGSQVILKKSHLGTQFFAHKTVGRCATAPETEAHLQLKKTVVDAARANGWEAATEVPGASPLGEQWTADVLAKKKTHKVAVEIQWAGQTNEETMRRQERYRQSGIRGLWLLRQPGFPITHDLPAVCIGGSLREGFQALIPSHTRLGARDRAEPDRWHQIVPMREFLDGVFSKRFQFGLPLDADALVSIRSGTINCWRRSCRARTRIVTFVELEFGHHKYNFNIRALGEHPELCSAVLSRLPPDPKIGEIKPRFSRTLGRAYMSNGCHRCDALIGEFFEHDAWYEDEEVLVVFSIKLSKEWKRAIEQAFGHQEFGSNVGWVVLSG